MRYEDETEIEISNEDYWFKIVEFLQQNWAVIESEDSGVKILFFHDLSGVFDSIEFDSLEDAETALKRNGFGKYNEDKKAQGFIAKPKAPLHAGPHLNNFIYSSGRFWY